MRSVVTGDLLNDSSEVIRFYESHDPLVGALRLNGRCRDLVRAVGRGPMGDLSEYKVTTVRDASGVLWNEQDLLLDVEGRRRPSL
jgi:hypothetical protein